MDKNNENNHVGMDDIVYDYQPHEHQDSLLQLQLPGILDGNGNDTGEGAPSAKDATAELMERPILFNKTRD